MYAVVRTGGKQYRVEEGRAVKVERLPGEIGDVVELGDVLLMDMDGAVTVGAPTISGARVLGTIAEQGRAKKIIVFRYKAKTRYRKKTGHRQAFTKVVVDDILAPGQQPKPKVAPESEIADAPIEGKGRGARRKAEAAPAAKAEPEVSDSAAVETPETDSTDGGTAPVSTEQPKRSRRKAE